MFAHKELSHKVHEPIRSENARHILVWVYRERCEHILYAFWVSHAVSVLILRRESFSSSAITHPVCSSVKTSRMRQNRKFANAWWGLDYDLLPNEKKKKKPEFQLRRFPWKARLINFKIHVGSSIPIYAFSKAMLLRMCHDTLCDFTQSAKPNNRKQ